MKILLYDSGIGLIPILDKAIRNNRLHDYHVHMEERHFPLGEKEEDFLISYAKRLLGRWKKEKYDYVVIACNTLSLAIKEIDLTEYPFRVLDILSCNLDRYDSNAEIIATLATSRYLLEKGYQARNCSYLVPLIEEGKVLDLLMSVRQMRFSKEKVILGCTHFPHILPIFRHYHADHQFIDGGLELAKKLPIGEVLNINGNRKARKYLKIYFSSHNPGTSNL